MSTEFLIDGELSGTGVRDAINGGYIQPEMIGISPLLVADIADWQRRYEDAHYAGLPNGAIVNLDEEGLVLLSRAQVELPHKRLGYFSHGIMKLLA